MSCAAGKLRLWLGVVLLVLVTVASGCTCGKKTDEAILEERIDCTAVHLYLATKEDSGIIEEKLGKGYFAINSVRIVLRHLDRAGVFDAIKDSNVVKTLDGYLSSASTALDKPKAFATGKGIVDGIKDKVKGD